VKINSTFVELPVELRSEEGFPLTTDTVSLQVEGPQAVIASFKNKDGRHFVSFSTETTGDYAVHLKHEGKYIKFAPITVNVRETDKSSAPVTELPRLDKHVVAFEVAAVDADGAAIPDSAELSVHVDGPEVVHPAVERTGNKIRISFDTHISKGTFSVGVLYTGRHIQRSPFEINVTPKSAEEQRVYDLQKSKEVASLEALPRGREIQFSVPAKMRDGSSVHAHELRGHVSEGEDSQIEVKISDDTEGQLLIAFEACKHGKHKVSVQKNGKDIAASPFKIDVPAAVFGAQ